MEPPTHIPPSGRLWHVDLDARAFRLSGWLGHQTLQWIGATSPIGRYSTAVRRQIEVES